MDNIIVCVCAVLRCVRVHGGVTNNSTRTDISAGAYAYAIRVRVRLMTLHTFYAIYHAFITYFWMISRVFLCVCVCGANVYLPMCATLCDVNIPSEPNGKKRIV